ncbi:immunoglobulin mu heavy chain-like [Carcharodon carcharias]|uniref:immunoglobulin mu heavy chain-like n=1 Tax=Carcharodon carcharias TaxID=13397 RepID=UPI001B7E6EB4|nr:immunoglobulin mu heavy chain-like [Carcharodon carcharias]
MGFAPYLCVLLLCLTGVWSAVVLTQPKSDVKKLGDSVSLSCTVSGYNINSYYMSWVKQVPGKGLEWLLAYRQGDSTYYAPGVQGRITFSTQSSTTSIEIPNLRADDTAIYYCARDTHSDYLDYWGSGTFLEVTSVAQSAPSVYITNPSCGMDRDQDEISFFCLVKDFHPKSITQIWSSNNGVITTGIQTYAAVQGNDKNYMMSSVLKVSASDWNANTVYHCKAGYKSSEMVERQITKPKVPIVTTLVPSAESVYNQTTTVLGCMISGFDPDSIKVSWKKGQEDKMGVVLPSQQSTDTTFERVTYLTVPVAEWKKGVEYTCEVSHTPSRFNKRISMRYTRNEGEISVFIQSPLMEEVWINKTATLVCTVVCSNPSQVRITWNMNGQERSKGVSTQQQREEGTQYIVTSRLRTTAEEWDSGVEFVCSAQSGSSSSPISKRVKSVKVEPKSPKVRLLLPPAQEIKNQSTATLECVITGFYPELLHVSWQKDGAPISNNTHAGLTALEQAGTFNVRHYLTVSAEEWRTGSAFSCTVSHPLSNFVISKEVKNVPEMSVFIQNPSVEEVWINKTATLVCAVVCSDPSQVRITWNMNGQERSKGVSTQRQREEGTQHIVTSRLRTTAEEWDSGVEFVCSAQSGSSSSPISKRAKSVKVEPKSPKVRLLFQPTEEIKGKSTATLECVITGFYPDLINVTWEKDGALISSKAHAGLTALEQAGTFCVRHYLTVSAEDWRKGSIFTCAVSHPPSNFNTSETVKNFQDECLDTGISVTLRKPPFEEIWRNRTATILCEVLHSDLEGVRVTWQADGIKREDGVKTQGPKRNGDKDMIFSRLTVPAAEWESGVEYLCLVEDKSLPTPEKRSIRKAQVDIKTHPQVYLLPPSQEEMEKDHTATLVCLVTGFSPAEIYLAWKANDTLLKSGFVNQPVTEDGRSGWNSGSRLTVSADEWNSGTTYSCVVGHESVTTNLFRSINKSHSKPTLVNVSLVLTDGFKSCS